jgi:predicted ATPase
VIASRIDRLSRDDKSLLQLAAVVGPRVSPQLLAIVTGMPAPQLQSQLWSLEILDFLVESRWLASVEYEFSHDLVREVAYDSILRPQREDLHRRILVGLERNSTGRAEEVAEALCHHAVKALDWAKVDRYGRMAAKKAFARSAFRDATEYFQIAMDAVDRLPYRSRASSGRSICAPSHGSLICPSETSSSGSPSVAMAKRAPRRSAMKAAGSRRSPSGPRH